MKKNESKAIGGLARAEKLTPERRSEIARNAALAKRSLIAIRKGNFLEDFGVNIDCYVLNDASATAVITQTGMAEAIGFIGKGGNNFSRFLETKGMSKHIGSELRKKITQPIDFSIKIRDGLRSSVAPSAKGHDGAVLIDLCDAIIAADTAGDLSASQANIARQAKIIKGASAKLGIKLLIYKLTGYDATKEEVIAAFKAFVQEEAKKYESEFPNELYLEWARLYGHKPHRSWKDMHLTIDHVYFPLARSEGRLLKLLREAKSSAEDRNAKLFQFLNEIGARALRFQLGRIYEIALDSSNYEVYENEIAKKFGGQQFLEFATS